MYSKRYPFISEQVKIEAKMHCQRLTMGFLLASNKILFSANIVCWAVVSSYSKAYVYPNMTIFTRRFKTLVIFTNNPHVVY